MNYTINKISNFETKDWLLNKHYAKRMCSISYAFGLYDDLILVGVITFGMPPSSTLSGSICGKDNEDIVLELNRLVVNEGLNKNALSYFVSHSINALPKNKIIVSFADANMNHNGYIYQATNFIYTGESSNTSKLIDKEGNEFHFRNIGHYQKNNKLNVSMIKRRLNENLINRVEIANYLKENKGHYKNKELDLIFKTKDTSAHWFRTDAGFSFPNIDNWVKLTEILNLDNTHDKQMLDFEMVADSNEIIKKLELTKVDILPKHRYIYFHTDKRTKKKLLKNLKLEVLPYPKGINKRYDNSYKPIVQGKLF